MDDERKSRYYDKLANLKKYYQLLEEWFNSNKLEEFSQEQNFQAIFAIYHAFELIIEVIIDISAMIVKDINHKARDSYLNFEVLLREKIITQELYDTLKELNGLRNRIVHDYNGLSDQIAWEAISNNLIKIPKFQEAIELWLKAQ
jgi:uncharacterized protein YutE (UPF0331/DUF86 family)